MAQGIRFTVVSRETPFATISGPEPDVEHYRAARQELPKRLQGQPATGEPREWQSDDLYDV
jgi:hypothetical protein